MEGSKERMFKARYDTCKKFSYISYPNRQNEHLKIIENMCHEASGGRPLYYVGSEVEQNATNVCVDCMEYEPR
jgi:hypothetical protein